MPSKPSEDSPLSGGSTSPLHAGGAPNEDFAAELLRRLSTRRTPQPRYEQLERVAQGGMGTIFRVRDVDLHRDLAMKVLRTEDGEPTQRGSTGSLRLARFVEEAQVTGQLDHPGIVPVHELGLDAQGRVFFTMKLVRGRTLRDVLKLARTGEEGWSTTRVVGVLLRVCEAMAYAHDKCVIHRDLKPSNLMVGRFGEVFVIDWGLARVLDRPDPRDVRIRDPDQEPGTQPVLSDRREHADDPESPLYTMDGDVFGTPAYMPPEQAQGDVAHIGTAADVYAVGAILYHVLAGGMPYGTPGGRLDNVAVWRAVKAGPPPPLGAVAPHAPAELVAICERAMQRDPLARYASMVELGDDLRAYLENRVVRAHRTGPAVELRKWVARNRGAAAGLAVALIASLAGVLVYASKEAQRADAENYRRVVLSAPELIRRAEFGLGPVEPSSLPAMEAWVGETTSLLGTRARYVRELSEMRAAAEAAGRARRVEVDAGPDAIFALGNARGWVAEFERALAEARSKAAVPDATEKQREYLRSAESVLPTEIAWWSERATRLAPAAEKHAQWQYDSGEPQEHDAELGTLVRELDELGSRALPDVRARIERARALRQETIEAPAVAARWTQAHDSILDPKQCPLYEGKIDLAPQLGLVPLERDAATGLWEFWHVQSGQAPRKDARGAWIIDADTGIVLVLVPGGHVWLGAQSEHPDAPFYDEKASATEKPWECDLDPYFLSKYEMTQGQWLKLTGEMPSNFMAGQQLTGDPRITRSNPVESVDFLRSRDVLLRVGLDHPTSAQWERAARGGVDAALGAKAVPSVLGRAANRLDARYEHRMQPDPRIDSADDDGFAYHAPVGTFPPNPYGLHEMLGNVTEFCLDGLGDNHETQLVPDAGTGLRTPKRSPKKTARGGDHARKASDLRPSALTGVFPYQYDYYLGVRPSRRVEKPH